MQIADKIIRRAHRLARNCLALLAVVLTLTLAGCGLFGSKEKCFENPQIIGGCDDNGATGNALCRDKGYDRATEVTCYDGKIVTLCCEK
jgi:hypothetical protein